MRIAFHEIPGFQVAVKRENDIRDAAFLDLTTDICGIPIRQMTPRDFIILDGVGDPIICGGLPTATQLAQFLWLLSPDYRSHAPFKAWLFARRCRRLPYIEAVNRCVQYVADTFQDAPGSSKGDRRQYASWCATLVDAIASEYKWTEEKILSTPFKRSFQYLKCIKKRVDPKAILHNPSDKEVGKYLKQKNARVRLLNLLRRRAQS